MNEQEKGFSRRQMFETAVGLIFAQGAGSDFVITLSVKLNEIGGGFAPHQLRC